MHLQQLAFIQLFKFKINFLHEYRGKFIHKVEKLRLFRCWDFETNLEYNQHFSNNPSVVYPLAGFALLDLKTNASQITAYFV